MNLLKRKSFFNRKISKEYNIPEDIIPNITYNQLKECKTIDFQTLLTESNKSKIKSIDIDDDIRNISRLPSLYVSFGLTPKKGGALSNISLKEMNYSASLGISFPLMGLFNSSENQRIKAISLSRTRNELLKDSIKLELLQKEIFQKLSTLKKNLAIVKNELSLREKKLNI
ncbi:TolC family protein [Escherichia coli]